jgi:hypothetical protein
VVGDNKDKLAQLLEETAIRLLSAESTINSDVPKAVEKAMENFKSYVVYRGSKKDILRNMSLSRILGEEMKELNNLNDKSLAIQILDHETFRPKIQQIFQRINKKKKMRRRPSPYVPLCSSKVMCIQIGRSQLEMTISIQQTTSEMHDVSTKVSWLVTETDWLNRLNGKRPWNV